MTGIANFTFCHGGDVLVSLGIPASVAGVGSMAFANCNALTALYVPASWEGTDMLANAGVPEKRPGRWGCIIFRLSVFFGCFRLRCERMDA